MSCGRALAVGSAACVLAALAGGTAALASEGGGAAAQAGGTERARLGVVPPSLVCPPVCAHSGPDGASAFMQGVELLISNAHDKESARRFVLASVQASPMCFKGGLTPEEYADAILRYQLLPPTLFNAPQYAAPGSDLAAPEFFSATTVWTGNGLQGGRFLAIPAQLTVSFAPDGLTWGDGALPTGTNNLNARLTAGFGSLDRGREYIRQSIAGWRRRANLTYTEVADDGSAYSLSPTRVASRGDVRIGGIFMGGVSTLAYNQFPTNGSDMNINSSYLGGDGVVSADYINLSGNDFRYLRNIVAHEHGHGLGFIHSTPCNGTKLMEPQTGPNPGFDLLPTDDIRGAQRNYGDVFAPNHSSGAATVLGSLNSPSRRSFIARNLSTNGATSGAGSVGEDWFRFTLTSAESQAITITVTPTGGTYQNGQQTGGCSPTNPPNVNATQAGNLNVSLTRASDNVVLATASAGGVGVAETVSFPAGLAAGDYLVRVWDSGPNAAANQTLQLYDLVVRLNGTVAPPVANAGFNLKRIQAGTTCWFMGDINSFATETGGSISSYQWDTDNDGIINLGGGKATTNVYVSNGNYPVTLRVQDNNGQSDTDTITVQVFGAASAATVTPSTGQQGATVPIVINGTNLKGITTAGQVVVTGPGVTVVGTPVPNFFGTQVTGLSLNISPTALPTLRNINLINIDGPLGQPWGGGTFLALAGAFQVTVPPPVACSPADIADTAGDPGPDGNLDNGDFSLFFTEFFAANCPSCGGASPPQCGPCDIADTAGEPGFDGCVDNGDFSLFFTLFFEGC